MDQHPITCPPELLGVAAALANMTPAQRAAAAGVIYSTLASVMTLQPTRPAGPPLTELQRATLDHLREVGGIVPAEELAHKIGVAIVTIRRWCNGPLADYGVASTNKGFCISNERAMIAR